MKTGLELGGVKNKKRELGEVAEEKDTLSIMTLAGVPHYSSD